jgi:hypothetical protein
MAIEVTVNGIPFKIPETGAQGWGEEMTAWCVKVSRELNNLITVGDIPLTTVQILNNQTTPALIPGLKFSISSVKGAFVYYQIERSTTSPSTKYTETGTLILAYNSLTTSWELAHTKAGTSGPETDPIIKGVQFSMVNEGAVGQMRYVSEELVGTEYTGVIRFRAQVIK